MKDSGSKILYSLLLEMKRALEDSYCRCECSTHGFGCGVYEHTCRLKKLCKRCRVLNKFPKEKP